MKNKFLFIQLFIMGLLIASVNSCKKDDELIVKKDVVITWVNPADITLPTALSTVQLNATADVPGTFVYTPPLGTVLSIGTSQNLKVEFTPTDTIKYNNATKTIVINVKGGNTVTDIDGNVYNTITIGTQTWMVENLKVTHYRNGDPIANVTDNTAWENLTTGAYCWYNNDITNKTIYGALYNWYAATDTRNIAPTGWHVPTDDEWTTLINYMGGTYSAAGKMKETGTSHWLSPNAGATNERGFTALGANSREIFGNFTEAKFSCWFWSSTSAGSDNAMCRALYHHRETVFSNNWQKICGFSIRCVKD